MSTKIQNPKNEYTLAIVGAGPRGTSVVERFADLASKLTPKDGLLKIVVMDPFRPGSGHVWNPHQSENFWMNTPASFPTVAPERVSDEPGLSFEQFVQARGDGRRLTEVHARAITSIGPGTYPSRAMYGEYLEHVFDSSCSALEAHESFGVEYLAAEVLAVRPQGSGYQLEYCPVASGNEVQRLAVDAVVLALGHQSADLNPWQKQLQEAATTAGALYLPPNVPSDLDFEQFAPGQPALIRGLGLNFFDTMAELTLGRGGIFREVSAEPGHRLEYVAAGREPELIVASRRGTPYWGKPVVDQFIPDEIELRFLDVSDLIGHLAELRANNPLATLEFSRHIWPSLHRDVLFAYYRQCAHNSGGPGGFSAAEFVDQVERILSAEHREGSQVWMGELRKFIAQFPEIHWLDVPKLAKPFEEVGFGSNEEYQKAVQDYLVDNAQHSDGGLDDPLSCAIMTMNAGRMLVKELIVMGVIDEQSRIEEIQAQFEPLVEGLASGPPLQRIEQLLALSRAGIVTFVGPEPEFGFDEVSGQFTASSPWVDAEVHTARTLCEAMMPSNRVLQNNSPLIKQLLAEHVGRVHTWRNAEGESLPGSGFDVIGEPYRLVNSEGLAHRGIFVLGLQLSSAQWGTAIAAQAGDINNPAARTLKDATHVANEVARLAGFLVGEGLPTERV
ncbi:FAD/NAD(P)-binding domain-containing protein [Glutamicibacter sp. JC586]|uniref:FAD/NAD(P)-binding protein n=1 Tax=Glutamicibacter sp. JC586 TaxID=2590552 RepID=UPI001359457A|nr:FAD/NAD(P)-binding protein [Glutamicibacter sp. JC586]